jgi:hypothetical protein
VDSENATSSGVNIGEGTTAPSNVNNWGRRIMSQLRAAFNPVLDAFFASTTLAQARTALGVSEGTTSTNNFAALTNAANKLPYMTGSNGWATTDLTAFARTILAGGDAAAVGTAMGFTVTTNANGTCLTIPASTQTYKLQFAEGSDSASEGSQTVTWPVAFGTSCLFAIAGTRISSASDTSDAAWQLVGAPGTATATVYRQKMGDGSITTSSRPTVIAFGY